MLPLTAGTPVLQWVGPLLSDIGLISHNGEAKRRYHPPSVDKSLIRFWRISSRRHLCLHRRGIFEHQNTFGSVLSIVVFTHWPDILGFTALERANLEVEWTSQVGRCPPARFGSTVMSKMLDISGSDPDMNLFSGIKHLERTHRPV